METRNTQFGKAFKFIFKTWVFTFFVASLVLVLTILIHIKHHFEFDDLKTLVGLYPFVGFTVFIFSTPAAFLALLVTFFINKLTVSITIKKAIISAVTSALVVLTYYFGIATFSSESITRMLDPGGFNTGDIYFTGIFSVTAILGIIIFRLEPTDTV